MTFAQLFLTPLGAIGEGISKFFAGTMLHVPIFLWPIIIVLVLIIIIIILFMYSGYELHLPFMMGSIRPGARAGLAPPPPPQDDNGPQQIENANARIQQLEARIQEVQQLQLEHQPTTARQSRTTSIGRADEIRQRSISRPRVNGNASVERESELRQRTTAPEIGFRRDILPDSS